MDTATIGIVTASLMAQAFAQGVAGETAKKAVESIVGLVRGRLGNRGGSARALAALEQNPTDADRIAVVGRLIDEETADEPFGYRLKELIEAARRTDPAVNTFVTEVRAGASVEKIVNIGHIDRAEF
jgi:hypothetical protein